MMPPSSAPAPSDPAGPSDSSSAYTRLHITPFDQELVKVILPSAVLPKARNISYHTIETFHEKRYGFVDLPETEAEKIKKKLNGAVLKGAKMRIEKARPEEDYMPVLGDEEDKGKKRKKKSKEQEEGTKKKRKRDHNVVEGVELRDRKVKRGWTVPEEAKIREKKSKKDKEKKDKKDKHKKREERSKYTDREECLIKTKLPAKLPATTPTDGDDESERKKRKKKSREVVIHEFEKTTKFPTFLKASKPAPSESLTTEFVEGKGWVDAEGNVIESEKTRRTASAPVPESEAPKKKKKAPKAPTPPPQDDDTTSSSGTSSDEDSSSDDSSDEETEVKAKPATPAKKQVETSKPPSKPVEDDTTSSSGSSSDESSDADSDDEMEDADKVAAPPVLDSPLAALRASDSSRPRSSGSNVSLTIKIPPPATPAKIHPLEALYKRPKADDNSTPQPVEEAEPFSFFGAGGDDDLEEEEDAAPTSQLPMTPFTKQEFEWRNVRSAAPTPDTAHPNHTKPFWAIGHEEDDEEDDEATQQEIEATLNAEQNAADAEGSVPAGEFQKWFWENRRNLNQSWMKRRKTAAKEKRHKDNKTRASKAV
ncbi:uncharacterized protein CTRU02_210720 [Colletotrichum truncatum]|uniref:Uncharacterized protein n=1 Tax=Colletotrichum truncatum TaxID=5467 RepID=A0ACC3YR31_COLTU|nr:uncharacterized protein CTRU02_03789 [Colletotrichum truncatum]KAF6796811.1 hypothetical protein CTRU02_03789 [Colletotrichum truncatum]